MKDENEVRSPDGGTSDIVSVKNENGFDLLDLWNMLERWKATVIGVALVTFVVIVANAFLNDPVPLYRAKALLSLPSERNIEGLRGEHLTTTIFRGFVKNLRSRSVRLHYFNEKKLFNKLTTEQYSDAQQVFEEKFNTMLSVNTQGDHATVNFDGENAKLAAEWVNGFITMTNEETVRELVEDNISARKSAMESKNNEIKVLRRKIADLRKKAKRKREDKIIQLEEMALIAERIGIQDVILKSDVVSKPSMIPHYIRGAKILRIEAGVLRERKNDAPFMCLSEFHNSNSNSNSNRNSNSNCLIHDLHYQLENLLSELAKTKLTHSDFSHVTTMQVVQMATVPDRAINKPVFKWVMLTGLLSALVLGVLAAFFADFIVMAREKSRVVISSET